MVSHAERARSRNAAPVPIHLVSFGDDIPYAEQAMIEFRNGDANVDSYLTARGCYDLRDAFSALPAPNTLFLNIAPSSYQQHLEETREYFASHSPLIVAPLEYKAQIPKELIAEYGIKLVPFYDESILDLPARLESLLRAKANETGSPSR